jgi:putative polyhydroxyalkanoate system protein
MADIDIERNHELGEEELRKRLSEMEAKLKEKYGVKIAWRGNQADIKGTGVSGTIALAQSKIAINLKLGLMMKPMTGKIREAMEKQLDKALV